MDRVTLSTKVKRVVWRRKRKLVGSSSKETTTNRVVPRKILKQSRDEDDIAQAPVQKVNVPPTAKSRSLEDFDDLRNHPKVNELLEENRLVRKQIRLLEKELKATKIIALSMCSLIQEQLMSEREFYMEQKLQYVKELRAAIKENRDAWSQTKHYISSSSEDETPTLVEELRQVRSMFYKQRQITFQLNEKFIKLRESRRELTAKMKKSETVYKTVIEELLKHLAETRIYYASLERGGLLDKTVVARLVDNTAKLAYNNSWLQIELIRLEGENARLKAEGFPSEIELTSYLEDAMLNRKNSVISEAVSASRVGSVISLPVAVVSGQSVRTEWTPLFAVVETGKKTEETPKEPIAPKKKRKAKSVGSVVWRFKRKSDEAVEKYTWEERVNYIYSSNSFPRVAKNKK